MTSFHVGNQARKPATGQRTRRMWATGSKARARLAALFLVFLTFAVPACSSDVSTPADPSTSSQVQTTGPAQPESDPPVEGVGPPGTMEPAVPTSRPPKPALTSSPDQTYGHGPGSTSDFATFQQNCEKGVESWRIGQVDYPRSLSIPLKQAADYNAAVDVRDNPLPPDQVIDSGEPDSEPVAVRCLLAAKLVPVGDYVKVNGTSAVEWAPRQFTPSGVMEWTWSITAEKPVDQQLRLVLVPAVLIEGGRYVFGTDSEASLLTKVAVEATLIERVSYWFETQWPLLVGIAAVLAVGIATTRKWIQEQFKASRRRTAGARAPGSRASR